MKPITNLETYNKAWDILRKANLHHFLDAGLLYAVQKLSEIQINVSDIITDLLTNGVLVEFMEAITGSTCYINDQNEQIPWAKVDAPIVGELISAFFTTFGSITKAFKLS